MDGPSAKSSKVVLMDESRRMPGFTGGERRGWSDILLTSLTLLMIRVTVLRGRGSHTSVKEVAEWKRRETTMQ